MSDDAMAALRRAQQAWQKSGRPGDMAQLALEVDGRRPEVVKGRAADKPRRRRRK